MGTVWKILRDVYTYAQGITFPQLLVWPPLQLAMPALVSHKRFAVGACAGIRYMCSLVHRSYSIPAFECAILENRTCMGTRLGTG